MKKKLLEKNQEELINAFTSHNAKEVHDLMSSVSHDVKNPLGIIELSLGLMEDKVEKLLIGQDEKIQDKIRNFFNNINVGLERCQEILDSSLDIKRTDIPDTPAEIEDLKVFCDNYYIFAKPKLKRKRINFSNAIEENVKITTIPHLLAKFLIESINYCTYNVECPEGAFMEITYDEDFYLTLTPKNESTIKVSMASSVENDIFNENFESVKAQLEASIELTEENNTVKAKLSLK
jgi:light-regulated signal transduction histidine kinase (bacteriophytochrome)